MNNDGMTENEPGGPQPEANGWRPTATYEIKQYWNNGKRIDHLIGNGESNFFLIMEINTPKGIVMQRPRVDAPDIETAFTMVPVIEKMIMDVLKQPRLVIPGGQPL